MPRTEHFRVIALISAFNEGDIIGRVIQHLVENEVDAYLLDNHSTDDTVAQAERWLGSGLVGIERFPEHSNDAFSSFDWTAILHRKEELGSRLAADWFIHHDADEIRDSPWPGTNLKQALEWVDAKGYNCVNFTVFNFPPIDDGFAQGDDPRTYFTRYEAAAAFDKLQLKAWKAAAGAVTLTASGGHEATIPNRRVFPIPFILRHYPIRGQTHGVRKVVRERTARFRADEKAKGWHLQYNGSADESHSFLRDPSELAVFDLEDARLRGMMPDSLLRALTERLLWADAEIERLRHEGQRLLSGLDDYKRHTANLEEECQRFAAGIKTYELHASNLEKEVERLQGSIDTLTTEKARIEAELGALTISVAVSGLADSATTSDSAAPDATE